MELWFPFLYSYFYNAIESRLELIPLFEAIKADLEQTGKLELIGSKVINYYFLQALRKTAKKIGLSLTIIQTNDESRAVNQLQNQRRKIKGILLFPGPWQQSGYVIKDTLDILSIPCITVSIGEKEGILKGMKNIVGTDIYKSSEKALSALVKLL